MLDDALARRHRWVNRLQSALLIGVLVGQAALLVLLIGGPPFAPLAVVLGLSTVGLAAGSAGRIVLRMYRARPVSAVEAPGLIGLVEALAGRAGLEALPRVYWIPSAVPNALSTWVDGRPAVAVTEGLLRSLPHRELAGVLAHEIGHITNRDLVVMGIADGFSRFTAGLGPVGMALVMVGWLGADATTQWVGLVLASSPTVATLLQLALSRTREFQADLAAVELTGDPEGLASALLRIEAPTSFLQRLVGLSGRDPNPSYLRTHPATEERVARLRALKPARRHALPKPLQARGWAARPAAPRLHRWGTWY